MIRLVMERAGLTLWPMLSFILFLVSSVVILIWLYRPGSVVFYRDLANLALGNDQPQARKN